MSCNKLAIIPLVVLVVAMMVAMIAPMNATNVQPACSCAIERDCPTVPTQQTGCGQIQCATTTACQGRTSVSLVGLLLTLVIDLVGAITVDLTAALSSVANLCASVYASVDVNVLLAATCSNSESFIFKAPGKCGILGLLGCSPDTYCLAAPSPKCTTCVQRVPQPCGTAVGTPDHRWTFGPCGTYFTNNQNNKNRVQQIIVAAILQIGTTDHAALCAKIKADLQVEIQINIDVIVGLDWSQCHPSYPRSDCYCNGKWVDGGINLFVSVYGIAD